MKLEGLDKEAVKLGVVVIGAGLIGGLCWKYRKKIMKGLMADYPRVYVEYELPSYTWVKGHWRFDRSGKVSYVRPHYRVTTRRRY
jgi:hypothetical protein